MTPPPRYLVPTNKGSVEHFYHFLLGYLCPISQWMDRARPRHVIVRDCGPMNPWFELLAPEVDVEIASVSVMLRHVVQRRRRCVILPPLDNVALFDRDVIRAFTARVRRGAGPMTEEEAEILVVDRGSSDPFYASPSSEVKTSGSERRSVSNMEELAAALNAAGECQLVDAALLKPREQVHAFTAARMLVGQHGAGLANMVWMAPGSTVVEILPPVRPVVVGIFPRLAAACGHRYVRVLQADLHGPVSIPAVLEALRAGSAHTTGAVAGTPAGWATAMGRADTGTPAPGARRRLGHRARPPLTGH